jgi:hypothetical protein
MHDQSLDRVNGRSTAAIATICERRLDTVLVLKSAETVGGQTDGAAVCADVCVFVKR